MKHEYRVGSPQWMYGIPLSDDVPLMIKKSNRYHCQISGYCKVRSDESANLQTLLFSKHIVICFLRRISIRELVKLQFYCEIALGNEELWSNRRTEDFSPIDLVNRRQKKCDWKFITFGHFHQVFNTVNNFKLFAQTKCSQGTTA